jgi:hypothetical protein
MRIAICFFGITRNLRASSLQAMEQNLFHPVRLLDPGFVRLGHFNLAGMLSNPRTKEIDVSLEADDHLKLGCDHCMTTPQQEVDQQIDLSAFEPFGDPWKDRFASMKNLLRQYYSLGKVTGLLLREPTPFDVVIFSRADVLYRSRLKIPHVREGVIYTPGFARNEGLNDRFALGCQAVMSKYGFRGRQAREYVEKTGKPLHAETFLKWYVEEQGLRNEDLGVKFWRIRANGKPSGLDSQRRHFYNLRARLISYLSKWKAG